MCGPDALVGGVATTGVVVDVTADVTVDDEVGDEVVVATVVTLGSPAAVPSPHAPSQSAPMAAIARAARGFTVRPFGLGG